METNGGGPLDWWAAIASLGLGVVSAPFLLWKLLGILAESRQVEREARASLDELQAKFRDFAVDQTRAVVMAVERAAEATEQNAAATAAHTAAQQELIQFLRDIRGAAPTSDDCPIRAAAIRRKDQHA